MNFLLNLTHRPTRRAFLAVAGLACAGISFSHASVGGHESLAEDVGVSASTQTKGEGKTVWFNAKTSLILGESATISDLSLASSEQAELESRFEAHFRSPILPDGSMDSENAAKEPKAGGEKFEMFRSEEAGESATSPIPEPSVVLLITAALCALTLFRRRRKLTFR